MASKAIFFILATLLLLTSKVSHGITIPSIKFVKFKPPTPVIKPLTQLIKPPTPVIKPRPTPIVVKPPTPVVKPPSSKVKPPPPPLVFDPPSPPPSPTVQCQPLIKSLSECGPLCERRCLLNLAKEECKKACQTCCLRCKCVPPGTYGNHQICGTCYSQPISHHDLLKCP